MAFSDLRAFIDAAACIGEMKPVDGAHWNLEIGCLTGLMAEQDSPLLLFDNIVDYPKGFRIATNILATARRFALALDLPTDVPKLEILKTWRNKIRDLKPYTPERRKRCQEPFPLPFCEIIERLSETFFVSISSCVISPRYGAAVGDLVYHVLNRANALLSR